MTKLCFCPLCDEEGEDIEHCLIKCPRVLPIWKKVWSWWNLPSPVEFPSFQVCDIAMGNISTQGCSRINKILHGVLQCVIWVIWKWRNIVVNASPESVGSTKEEDIFPAIQRISKNWISARLKTNAANWNNWISKPFDLFLPS